MSLPGDWYEEETGQRLILNPDKVEAEIERLTRERNEGARWRRQGESELRAEIERLRAALNDCIHGRRDWIEKAKRALEGK